MELTRFYVSLACITTILSMSLVTQVHLIPLLLSLVSLALTTLIGIRIDSQKHAFVPLLVDLALQVALIIMDIYTTIPLLLFIMGIFSFMNERYTFYRILISSSISAFIFPISYSVSLYNLIFAPILVLQTTSLVVMKEAISNMNANIGKIAYSILFGILIALTFDRLEILLAIIIIGILVYMDFIHIYTYNDIVKIIAGFSLILFINYVLPIYVAYIS